MAVTYTGLVTNGGFESNSGSNITPTGWNVISGNWSVLTVDGSLNAFEGSNFLSGNSASFTGEMDQVIDLTAAGVSGDNIDAGHVTINFTSQRSGAGDALDEGRVLVQFLNALDVVQGTLLDTGLEAISTLNTWFERAAGPTTLPATTRKIRIFLEHNKQPAGSIDNSAFDAVDFTITDAEGVLLTGPNYVQTTILDERIDSHTDPNFNDVHLLLGFDQDLDGATSTTDESSTGTAVTFSGTAQIDDAQAKFGHSLLLGSNAFISIPNSAGASVANTVDKCYEAWIRRTAENVLQSIMNKRDSGDAEEFRFMVLDTNVLEFRTWRPSNLEDIVIVGSDTLSLNVFHHVAATRQSAVWRLFLDGVLQGTQTEVATPESNTHPLRIGSSGFNASRFLTGHIDEIRITHGAARYTASFTPPFRKFPRS